MPTLASDLIAETRQHLGTGMRGEVNRLTTTMDASIATLTFDFAAGGIVRGAVLGVDLELMLVWSLSGQVATVQRGWAGSAPAAHTSGAYVWVTPVFSAFAIFRALNQELAALSSPINGLYRVRTKDITYNPARVGYDLAADVIDVLDVQAVGYLPGDLDPVTRWSVKQNQDTVVFPSGNVLYLYAGGNPGKNLRVVYQAPFVALSAVTDDVAAISFLPATALDIPPLGAAARLLAPLEATRARGDAQPEPRAAVDVPPGTARNAAAGFLALRKVRVNEESARLSSQWPTRRRAIA